MNTVVIFSVLLIQSSASVFNELTGVLGTMESNVGKLLSDVGHDLKETYDCTIDAVEEVLYDKDQIPKYYDKCKPTTSTESNNVALNAQNKVTNKSINIIINSEDIDKKLASVEEVINNEYFRVDNMSSHLEHKIDGLAQNVDKELKKIEEDKVDLHLEIEKLHLQEDMAMEKTKEEIREAFDEMLKKIGSSSNKTHTKNETEEAAAEQTSNKNILHKKNDEQETKELEDLTDIKKNETHDTTISNIPVTANISKQTLTNNKVPQPLNTILPQTLNNNVISSTEPVTRVSITSTIASTKALYNILNKLTSINSKETVTRSTTVATTTDSSIKPATTTSTAETITRVSAAIISTKDTTEPVIVLSTRTSTLSPVTHTPMTTTLSATEPTITLKLKKHAKKSKIKNKYKRTRAWYHKTLKTTTPKPPDDYDGLIPKDPKAAAAKALKLFNKSIKTKSVLDNFLNRLKRSSSVV